MTFAGRRKTFESSQRFTASNDPGETKCFSLVINRHHRITTPSTRPNRGEAK